MKLTREMCYAAGMDAGNLSMRQAGRTKWNEDDYNACVRVCNRLLDSITKLGCGHFMTDWVFEDAYSGMGHCEKCHPTTPSEGF